MKLAFYPRCVVACGSLLVLLAFLPSLALADAPGVRGPEIAPAGAVGSPVWNGIEPLPPITGVPIRPGSQTAFNRQWTAAKVPGATIYGQAAEQPAEAATFSLRALNPGNWVLDAGLGIMSSTMQSIQQTLLGFVSAVAGVPPGTVEKELSLGCTDSSISILFCTKPDDILPPGGLTVADSQAGTASEEVQRKPPLSKTQEILQKVWIALQPAAFVLLTIVFTVRLGRVMHAGPAAFQGEVKALLLPFLAACALVAATPALLSILLSFFAALNIAILNGNLLGTAKIEIPFLTYLPTDFLASLSLGPTYALLALFVVLFVVFVVALIRLAKLILLLAIAPLAGATLIDRSTAPLFGNWLSKVLELLLHQLGWSITAVVGSAILNTLLPGRAGRPTDPDSFVVHTIATALVLLFMLCQQQLFSGVFQLAAGGTSPVMGGAMDKAATFISVRDGIRRRPHPAAAAGNTPIKATPARAPKPQPVAGSTQPAAFRGWYGGGAGPISKNNAQPGSRARASTNRSNAVPPMPPAPPAAPAVSAQASHAAPAVSTQASHAAPAAGLAASSGYVAAGRVRRKPVMIMPPAAAVSISAASPERLATIRHLQAQAAQTGYQAWRAAPAAFAQQERWNTVRPGSVAGQRALRELKHRGPVS